MDQILQAVQQQQPAQAPRHHRCAARAGAEEVMVVGSQPQGGAVQSHRCDPGARNAQGIGAGHVRRWLGVFTARTHRPRLGSSGGYSGSELSCRRNRTLPEPDRSGMRIRPESLTRVLSGASHCTQACGDGTGGAWAGRPDLGKDLVQHGGEVRTEALMIDDRLSGMHGRASNIAAMLVWPQPASPVAIKALCGEKVPRHWPSRLARPYAAHAPMSALGVQSARLIARRAQS